VKERYLTASFLTWQKIIRFSVVPSHSVILLKVNTITGDVHNFKDVIDGNVQTPTDILISVGDVNINIDDNS
jgi:hypothetical protein